MTPILADDLESFCNRLATSPGKKALNPLKLLRGDERLQSHGRGAGRVPHQAGAAAVQCGTKVHRLLGQEESPERPVSWLGLQV